ncbi:hypothetical protein FMM74_020495 [Lachnospiraceae bacterium MD308]|nr:hypothetical protein [Lachnospiraceae bacterium MD308]
MLHINLLQEYKELYYKEIEFSERLNNKISTCITFLTILGSALIFLWTRLKEYKMLWYTGIYIAFCIITSILFCICVIAFFITYSGYKTQMFPIKDYALQNMRVLNSVKTEQKQDAYILLEQKMAERFINDAIHNRKLNVTKNNRHRLLIQIIMSTFIFIFLTFSIGVSIDFYESKCINDNVQHIYTEGGELNAR